uniref:LAGLIDADG homing endonuclease n=1 Tax=Elmerina hispida TaxID=1245649 RepID=UPI0030038D3E
TLRYTLMGFERNYPLRIPSNQFNKLFFSTICITQLNPYFITGFCDAESSFQIVIIKNKNSKLGWSVQPFFTIGLHSRDLVLLSKIKSYFSCGTIVKNEIQNEVSFRVSSLQDLTEKIIPHFLNYPLLTQKKADFLLFKQATDLLLKKSHLTMEGLQELVNIKSSMNLGISNDLKLSFINTVPTQRLIIKTTNIPDFN